MKTIKYFLIPGVVIILSGMGYLYSGFYPMSANVPHNNFTYWVLETLRERSVARASNDIQVPDLSDPDLLLAGGADYNDMCTGCHLKPGETKSDMSIGLYPAPSNLTVSADNRQHVQNEKEAEQKIRRQFWIIKHGIKASGMPAWGLTHDDERIWAMVAFLQKLPELTPVQYQILTVRAPDSEGHH